MEDEKLAQEDAVQSHRAPAVSALSKFSLSRLALKAALELEKAKDGQSFGAETLQLLADALSQTSPEKREGATFRAIRAGFHRPFLRLYRDRQTEDPQSLEQIRSFLADVGARLYNFRPDLERPEEADQLIAFCTSLHRGLVHGLSAENRLVLRQRKTPRASTPRVGAAAA